MSLTDINRDGISSCAQKSVFICKPNAGLRLASLSFPCFVTSSVFGFSFKVRGSRDKRGVYRNIATKSWSNEIIAVPLFARKCCNDTWG